MASHPTAGRPLWFLHAPALLKRGASSVLPRKSFSSRAADHTGHRPLDEHGFELGRICKSEAWVESNDGKGRTTMNT
jgi:hypothetical protein